MRKDSLLREEEGEGGGGEEGVPKEREAQEM